MIRIGLLGAGTIAKTHAQAYATITRSKVVAVADLDIKQASELAASLDAEVAVDCTEIINRKDIDAVDICLPTFIHARYTVEAAQMGKHVLCEKPIATTLADADAMIEATERAGVILMVAQVLRFWPQYVALKRILDGGEIGKPLAIYAARLGTAPTWTWNKWILDPILGGGVLLDLQIHDLDYITWLWGPPKMVNACGVKSSNGAWSHVFTTLAYEDGRIACAEATFLVPRSFPFTMTLRVVCEDGTAVLDYRGGVNIEARDSVQRPITVYTKDGDILYPEVSEEDAYKSEIEYFIDCVENKQQPQVVKPCEARLSLAIALAAMQSAAKGGGGECVLTCLNC